MNTEEGNKLIVEFLDWEYKELEVYKVPDNITYQWTYYDLEDLEFHSSWDWLMPVVEKIEGIETDLGITVVIKENKCGIYRYKNSGYEIKLSLCEADSKIKATYLAIIEFIQWYNSIQPSATSTNVK